MPACFSRIAMPMPAKPLPMITRGKPVPLSTQLVVSGLDVQPAHLAGC
jgi:hypothetical protein